MYHWKAGRRSSSASRACRAHLLAPSRHVAELEQVGDAPVVRLELGVAVAGVARRGDHLVGDRQALLDAVGPPQRHVPRAQGGRERTGVAGLLGGSDGFGAERLRARPVGCVVQLDR